MRIAIDHVTQYRYGDVARYCVLTLRMTPESYDGQSVVAWDLSVEPSGQLTSVRDGLGNALQLATVTTPHDQVTIRARGIVEVADRTGVVKGLHETAPPRVFLRVTPLTVPDAGIKALVDEIDAQDTVAKLHTLMDAIRDRVDYKVGVTEAQTTAAEALASGVGVCQDHAHIFIAAARYAGIPARYITGYLVIDEGSDADAHHAWAEAWVEGLGWVGFDVANRVCPTERYVRLAHGLDAHFASPVRGSRRGMGSETLTVSVQVRPEGAPPTKSQSQSQSQTSGADQRAATGSSQAQAQSPVKDAAQPTPADDETQRQQ